MRLDRLARRTRDARYQRRLDEVKSEWSAANMPSHYRAALESTALTRAELAVLDQVRWSPVIFQEYVPAEVDLIALPSWYAPDEDMEF